MGKILNDNCQMVEVSDALFELKEVLDAFSCIRFAIEEDETLTANPSIVSNALWFIEKSLTRTYRNIDKEVHLEIKEE